jgi:hypothetical protein
MEKISRENVGSIATKSRGGPRIRSARIYDQLFSLEKGEGVTITRREWATKSPPYWCVNRVSKNRGQRARFSCRTLVDESGWLITRIK